MIRSRANPVPGEGSPLDVPPAAFGRYRVLHQIGVGAFGPVFRSEDPDTKQPLAIKALRVPLGPDRARELVRALLGLRDRLPSQPVVVGPTDAGIEGGVPYYVMRFATGDPLDLALRDYGPAAIADALPRLRTLANALDAAAANGICHGALTPRDVVVSADALGLLGLGVAPLLVDFGVKPDPRRPYTAPEILEAHRASPAADQFALASIAHEWLFGRPIGGAADALLELPVLPGVDEERLAAAFTTALATKPADRFATTAGFVAAVSAAVRDLPEHATASKRPSPAAGGAKKVRSVAPSLPLEIELPPNRQSGDVDRIEPLRELTIDSRRAAAEAAPSATASWQGRLGVDPPPAPDRRSGNGVLLMTLVLGIAIGLAGGYWLGTSRTAARSAQTTGVDQRASTEMPVADNRSPAESKAGTASPAAISETATREIPREEPAKVAPPAGPPSQPAAAPARGRLLVRTTPAGARVTVDGVERGETPLTLQDLAFGTHIVAINAAGFGPIQRRVVLSANRPSRSIEERLASLNTARAPARNATPPASAKTTGILVVESRPAGARVIIDGRPAGETPLTLDAVTPGRHSVRIDRAGYRPWSTTVEIVSGQRARVAASLVGGQAQE